MNSPTTRLRGLLAGSEFLLMPCCYDALSARLIELAGFPLTFMSGFAVAASRLALPDTGLISFGEMLDQGRSIAAAVTIPVLADADTGFGNEMNVRRTVDSYAAAGLACAMIEDQLAPKRCGHVAGKQVVDRRQCLNRIRAAVDAREAGADILIMARTDARTTHGLEEALWRCQAFADLGADILFMEAPESREEMRRFCREVPGIKMANMLEGGRTPVLAPVELADLGYRIAAYPLALLSASVQAVQQALAAIKAGTPAEGVDFVDLREIIGFDAYIKGQQRYATEEGKDPTDGQ